MTVRLTYDAKMLEVMDLKCHAACVAFEALWESGKAVLLSKASLSVRAPYVLWLMDKSMGYVWNGV